MPLDYGYCRGAKSKIAFAEKVIAERVKRQRKTAFFKRFRLIVNIKTSSFNRDLIARSQRIYFKCLHSSTRQLVGTHSSRSFNSECNDDAPALFSGKRNFFVLLAGMLQAATSIQNNEKIACACEFIGFSCSERKLNGRKIRITSKNRLVRMRGT